MVYVARNTKDAIVSFYHHHKLVKLHDFRGNLEEFADYFMEDEGIRNISRTCRYLQEKKTNPHLLKKCYPVSRHVSLNLLGLNLALDCVMGSLEFIITTICTVLPIVVLYAPFFPHILDAWSKRNHPNMHFMFFEDMKKVIRFNVILIAYMTGLNFWLRI